VQPLKCRYEKRLRKNKKIDETKMKKNKIAFQGELGAYSHIAAKEFFKDAEIKTCSTFEEAFKVAHEDETFRVIIPLENSLAGRVADIHYLLPKYKLQIHAEHFQRVEHNLLAKPDANIEDIKYVRSHAQAIGQCQNIIMKNNFKTIISADTAGSAKELSTGTDKSIAAIASELSAEIYKLKILKKNIEDEKSNFTRFVIMGKEIKQPDFTKDKIYITTCIFRLKSEPSALFKCLGGFATNQINLTKLESFSVKNTFDQTNFYLDFEGHLEEKRVQNAMEELGFHTQNLDILGVYEASKFRQN
jgi:prephenate dehydratase